MSMRSGVVTKLPWPTSPFVFLGFGVYLHLSSLQELDVADGFLGLTMPRKCQQSWASQPEPL